MTRKKHIALAALFVVVNLLGGLINSSARGEHPALDAAHYEAASDAELARAWEDGPIVCVAASTESGCG